VGAPDGGAPAASPTKFVLENHGVAPLVVGNMCGGTWLGLSQGEQSLLVDRSCSCPCSMPDICGCPAICRITEALLVPGGSLEAGWDGVAAAPASGAGCYNASVPALGSKLTAEACWNIDDQSGARNCVSQKFMYGAETVTLRAIPAALTPTRTTIELDNQTGGEIAIVVNRCGAQGWYNISRGAEPLSVSTFCPCTCDEDYGVAGCPTCGACAPDTIQTLADGETKSAAWDGKFWYSYPSSCQLRYDFPASLTAEIKVCWTPKGEAVQRCAAASFAHGQTDPVRIVAR
jgi:hypothetical protein